MKQLDSAIFFWSRRRGKRGWHILEIVFPGCSRLMLSFAVLSFNLWYVPMKCHFSLLWGELREHQRSLHGTFSGILRRRRTDKKVHWGNAHCRMRCWKVQQSDDKKYESPDKSYQRLKSLETIAWKRELLSPLRRRCRRSNKKKFYPHFFNAFAPHTQCLKMVWKNTWVIGLLWLRRSCRAF